MWKENSAAMKELSHHLQGASFLAASTVVSKRHHDQHYYTENYQHSHSWRGGKQKQSGTDELLIMGENLLEWSLHWPVTKALELSSAMLNKGLVLSLNLNHKPRPKKANPTTCERGNQNKFPVTTGYVSHPQNIKLRHFASVTKSAKETEIYL